MQMTGRTILITGGTSGIGFEMARQLSLRGNTVVITGRDRNKLDAAQRTLVGVHVFESDAGDPEDIERLFDVIVDRFPKLNVLVNNAGMMRNIKLDERRPLAELTTEIDTNLKGPMWMIEKFLPLLRRQSEALIVNVSSGLAFVPFPAAPIYSASKAAMHAYSRCLRTQLEGTGVSVIELAPPGTETPLFRDEFAEEMKGEKGMDVKVLVGHAIAGIEAGKPEIRPGLSNVLKIASRVAPQLIFKQMVRLSRPKPAAS